MKTAVPPRSVNTARSVKCDAQGLSVPRYSPRWKLYEVAVLSTGRFWTMYVAGDGTVCRIVSRNPLNVERSLFANHESAAVRDAGIDDCTFTDGALTGNRDGQP